MTDKTPWIQTITGKRLDLDPPNPDQIDIEDIAHGLSMLCRFNGQCTRFYSVAEHSVHASREIDTELALVGLLHDAAEAYLGDVPSPLKKQLSQFSGFEEQMEKAVGEKFGIDYKLFAGKELKRADVQLLIDEKAVLMVDAPEPWPPGAPETKDPNRIKCWSPEEAKERFLERFGELTDSFMPSKQSFPNKVKRVFSLDHNSAFNFFVCFSRFEYAAKAQELHVDLGERQRCDLKVDWRKVAERLDEKFVYLSKQNPKIQEAVKYFANEPPQKQVLKAGGPQFTLPKEPNVSETEVLLLALRRIRNNLFHGGKGIKREDLNRDQKLVDLGLIILEGLIESDDILQHDFFEKF